MPHWNGIIDTSSPPILADCGGDPAKVRAKLFAEAPAGTSITAISWLKGQHAARITVEGPTARDFLVNTLEARDVVELLTTHERQQDGDPAAAASSEEPPSGGST